MVRNKTKTCNVCFKSMRGDNILTKGVHDGKTEDNIVTKGPQIRDINIIKAMF